MNVSNDFCPFLCWSVYWCFVVKVSIPQESKNTTHETDFYSLPCTWYIKNVSLINLLFILIVKTGKLSDGFLVYRTPVGVAAPDCYFFNGSSSIFIQLVSFD